MAKDEKFFHVYASMYEEKNGGQRICFWLKRCNWGKLDRLELSKEILTQNKTKYKRKVVNILLKLKVSRLKCKISLSMEIHILSKQILN